MPRELMGTCRQLPSGQIRQEVFPNSKVKFTSDEFVHHFIFSRKLPSVVVAWIVVVSQILFIAMSASLSVYRMRQAFW